MIRDDETQWIEAALERYEKPLLRSVTRLTGNVEVARDVVQDTFLKLCRADRQKVEQHLAGWLFTVSRNGARDVMKKEGRMGRPADAHALPDPAPDRSPSRQAMLSELHRLVLETISELPEDQQEAFRLKFQDHMTYREISQVMGRSLGTVSKLLTAALGRVRRKLGGHLDAVQEG